MCSTTIEWYLNDNYFFLSKKKEDNIIGTYNLEKLTEEYSKELYKDQKLASKTEKKLFHSVYQPLKEAVQEGYGQIESKVEYGTPNYEMLKNLKTNAGVYTAFKNHAMVKETVALLKDENGNLKPFQQFKTDALKNDEKYRKNWLKTEYDTAVRTARMAAQWERIQRTKHLYPNLEYIRSKAANPDIDHLALVGTILPVDDPFWNTYYPPSRWNCQCSVRQTDKAITDIPADAPTVEKGFAFNAGKMGQVFDVENSDYYKAATNTDLPRLLKFAKNEVNKDIAKETPYIQFSKSKSGGKIEIHPLTIENADFQENLPTARELANKGYKIAILPELIDEQLRMKLLPLKSIKNNSNPDYYINNKFVADLKTITSNKVIAVKDAFSRCNEQCNNIVLYITEESTLPLDDILKTAKGKLKHENNKKGNGYSNFDKVWINYKREWLFTDRKTILGMQFENKR